MQIITDEVQIKAAGEKIHIEAIMDHTDLPCTIHVYEKGELITAPGQPSRHLLFCISGTVQIYDLDALSSVVPIAVMEHAYLIGDMEFCGERSVSFYSEAVTQVRCLAFEIAVCKSLLDGDIRFLHFLLESLSEKLAWTANYGSRTDDLRQRLVRYMTFSCREQTLSGVSKASVSLHCSRRQLQRVLAELCETGEIKKIGKGLYRLL